MKFTKVLTLLAGSLMSLTACSTGTGGNVDQTLPDGDPSRELTINFWHCLGHAKTEQMQIVIDKFNEDYKGKYKVVLTKMAGDYGDLDDVIRQKISAGEVPALAMGYPDSFSAYMTRRISRSKILRLGNFIDKEKCKYGYSTEELNDFVPAYWSEGSGYQFDGVWSVPLYKSTEVMYYNKTFFYGGNEMNSNLFTGAVKTGFDSRLQKVTGFEKEKHSPEDIAQYNSDMEDLKSYVKENNGYTYEVPETWEDMITTAQAIQQARAATGCTGTFFPIGYDSDSNLMITQLEQLDYAYTKNDAESEEDGTKHYQFKNANTEKLLGEITGYIKSGLMHTKGSLGGNQYTNTYFTAKQCVMSIGSTGGSSYQTSGNFDVSIAHVPVRAAKLNDPDQEHPYKKYIQQGPSLCFFDNNNKYIHKGAWLFYRYYLSDPTNNAVLALENSYDPIRVSSYDTVEYKTWVGKAGRGLQYDIPNITQTLKNNYMTSPVFVGSGEARTQIGNTISYVIGNKMSIHDAISTAYNYCISDQ